MTGSQGDILTKRPAPRNFDIMQAMRWAQRTYGKGAIRQFAEIVSLRRRPNLLQPKDYYLHALFRPEFDADRRRAYVSHDGGEALNLRLSPIHANSLHGLTFDKVLTAALLERLGMPTPRILAHFPGDLSLEGLRSLRTAGEIAAFLSDATALPCFGKPVLGSNSIGAASFLEVSGDGARLRLGDGREVATADVAAEIARDFPHGYIFQPLLRQRPELEALNGPAVGVLRVVTLRERDGPSVLYTVLKMPPAGAMYDGGANATPNAMALIDPSTGRLLRAQDMARMCSSDLKVSLATGAPLADVVLPDVGRATEIACALHRWFRPHGVLGCDIALTVDGPSVTEINTRPFHTIYQRAADRAILEPPFRERIDEAIALSAGMIPARRGYRAA